MEKLKEQLCEQCRFHDQDWQENFKEEALLSALAQKHSICIEELITAGANVNYEHKHHSLLETAAASGSVDSVQLLLKAGADVNQTTRGVNYTALLGAVMAGSVECTELLITAGADVNLKQENEKSAIIQAVQNGYPEIVQMLLKAGADVNEIDYSNNWTALMLAAYNGHDDVVDILIKAGADVNEIDYSNNWTALLLAAYNGHDDVVDILIKAGADVNRVRRMDTALKLAAECSKENVETHPRKYKRCLQMLIEAGADVKANPEGSSALHIACRKGFNDGAELLIKAGANVNMLGDAALNPLMEAVANGHVRCAELLLEAGAEVNFQNTRGITAVMHIGSGSPMFDHEGEIYWMKSIQKKDCLNCTNLLLSSRAKINLMDIDSRNALQHQVALYNRPKGSDDIRNAVSKNILKLERTLHINSSDRSDICLLLYAAGETLGGPTDAEKLPDCLKFESLRFNLKHLCREAIRKHLLSLDPHTHLFDRIPQLGLPSLLSEFLLYNVRLEQ